jgi:hypothetical protein
MALNYGRVSISDQVLSQSLSGESVLLDLKSEQYFGLDSVGTRLWELLKELGDVTEAREYLLREYDVAADQLDRDLNDLLDKLMAAGLIRKG